MELAFHQSSHSVLIGVGQRASDKDHMAVTVNDAQEFKRCLVDHCGFRDENVELVIAPESTGRQGILESLDGLVAKSREEGGLDQVILFFSGHGGISEGSGKFYFVCHDTVDEDLEGTGLSAKRFIDKVNQISARRVLVLLDTCHAGKAVRSTFSEEAFSGDFLRFSSRKDRAVIASSRHSEPSFTSSPLSLFTVALIEGITGVFLDEEDTDIRLFDLAMWTREAVRFYSKKRQSPVLDCLPQSDTTNFLINRIPNSGERKKFFEPEQLARIRTNTGEKIFQEGQGSLEQDRAYRKKFDFLKDIKRELFPLTHISSIEDFKGKSKNRSLFENDLVYFTEKENENIGQLIHYLSENKACLMSGYPATGKSISVVAIADQLALQGDRCLYFSLEQKSRWDTVLVQITRYASDFVNTVYIIDNIHLAPDRALELYDQRFSIPNLRVIFISRFVNAKNRFAAPIFGELGDFTVTTGDPDLNEKVIGVIQRYEEFYNRKDPETKYYSGIDYENIEDVEQKFHRNLIVLRKYLEYWGENPAVNLLDINEDELFQDIYNEYFTRNKIDLAWENCLLQYLCLFFFEIQFEANPRFLGETDNLARESKMIVSEGGGLFSIYHGEFAALLIRAYAAIKVKFRKPEFDWTDFFFDKIREYLLGFVEIDSPPSQFLEIISEIFRSNRSIQELNVDSSELIQKLMDDPEIEPFLFTNFHRYLDSKECVGFLAALARASLDKLKPYLSVLVEAIYDGKCKTEHPGLAGLIGYTLVAYKKEGLVEDRTWLLQLMVDDRFNKILKPEGFYRTIQWVFQNKTVAPEIFEDLKAYVAPPILLEKAKTESFGRIGTGISLLTKIDTGIRFEVFTAIPNSVLIQKAKEDTFNNFGMSLIYIYNIYPQRARQILDALEVDELEKMALDATFSHIANGVNEINIVDEQKAPEQPNKAKKLLNRMDPLQLKELALKDTFPNIGNGLNEIFIVDEQKAKDVSGLLEPEALKELALRDTFSNIGNGINEIFIVDDQKAIDVMELIEPGELRDLALEDTFSNIGNAINEIHIVAPQKAKEVLGGIAAESLRDLAIEDTFSNIGHAINEIGKVLPSKAEGLLELLEPAGLVEKALESSFTQIGDTLRAIYNLDQEFASDLCSEIGLEAFFGMVNDFNGNYNTLLIGLGSLAKANPGLAGNLLGRFSLDFLIRKEELKTLHTFLPLAFLFHGAEYEREEEAWGQILEVEKERREIFLRTTQLRSLTNYLYILSEKSDRAPLLIEKYRGKLMGKVLHAPKKDEIAYFISAVHRITPQFALRFFLKNYKDQNPWDFEPLGFSTFFIGKNYRDLGDLQNALYFFRRAKVYFTELKLEDQLKEVDEMIDEILARN